MWLILNLPALKYSILGERGTHRIIPGRVHLLCFKLRAWAYAKRIKSRSTYKRVLTHRARIHKLRLIKLWKELIMEVIVKKRGNSTAVRIPASVMAAAHVALDQPVEVREEQWRIIIESVRRITYKLEELLGGITAKNLHKPVATGAPVGKKIW